LTLSNIVTLKSGLEGLKTFKLVPFEILGVVFYSPSIVGPNYGSILHHHRD